MRTKPVIGITTDYDMQENRYYLREEYEKAIAECGGIPVGIFAPAGRPVQWSGGADELLEGYTVENSVWEVLDGILFSGGEDLNPMFYREKTRQENGEINPIRDRHELNLAREAMARDIPCLGICRGIQVMAVARGGSVWQDLAMLDGVRAQHKEKAPNWYPIHSVSVVEGSRLKEILGASQIRVNSSHHQAVRESREGQYSTSGIAEDGVVEAIETRDLRFWLGVQWHPERMLHDPIQRRLFQAFIDACSATR